LTRLHVFQRHPDVGMVGLFDHRRQVADACLAKIAKAFIPRTRLFAA
jgi:hypothetical protein